MRSVLKKNIGRRSSLTKRINLQKNRPILIIMALFNLLAELMRLRVPFSVNARAKGKHLFTFFKSTKLEVKTWLKTILLYKKLFIFFSMILKGKLSKLIGERSILAVSLLREPIRLILLFIADQFSPHIIKCNITSS